MHMKKKRLIKLYQGEGFQIVTDGAAGPLMGRSLNRLTPAGGHFLYDTDGDLLQALYDEGFDFESFHDVEFDIIVPNKESAWRTFTVLKRKGLRCEIREDQIGWYCTCIINMLFTYETLYQMREVLYELVSPYDGRVGKVGIAGR